MDDAIASYNKCLSAAERSGDNATAAKANYRIGGRGEVRGAEPWGGVIPCPTRHAACLC